MSQCSTKHKCWSDSRPVWYCMLAKGHEGPHELDDTHAGGESETCATVAQSGDQK